MLKTPSSETRESIRVSAAAEPTMVCVTELAPRAT